ncbi:hypothetical protein Pelo_7776 [Pelomyxa schiedti]|nr:hypothetical protein Pelo_7776 [Pelomyxa schiedti]
MNRSKQGGGTATSNNRRHVVNKSPFSSYIYRVLRQVHADIGISKKAMAVMDDLVQDMFRRVAKEAALLCRVNRRCTLTSREVQTATRLVLLSQLQRTAVAEGVKAVTMYNSRSAPSGNEEPAIPKLKKKSTRRVVGQSERAGLLFPVGRINTMLREGHYSKRTAPTSGVYLAAVLEFLVRKVLDVAGQSAKDMHKVRIVPRLLFLALFGDSQLSPLVRESCTISSGGVLPTATDPLEPNKEGTSPQEF